MDKSPNKNQIFIIKIIINKFNNINAVKQRHIGSDLVAEGLLLSSASCEG